MARQRDMINPTATTAKKDITPPAITPPAITILKIQTVINPTELTQYAIKA